MRFVDRSFITLEEVIMRRFMLVILISLLAFSSPFVFAKSGKQVDAAGVQFWAKFKAAVVTNDKETVASMTRLPFLFQGRELTKPAFIQKFGVIFDARAKRCFEKAKLVKEGEGFEVFCGQQIFLFEKVNGVYKFTEIAAND
jgi:hypothetical protein